VKKPAGRNSAGPTRPRALPTYYCRHKRGYQNQQPQPPKKQVSMHRGPVDESHHERCRDALSEDWASHVDALDRWVPKYAHAGLEGSRLLSVVDRGSKRRLPSEP